MFVIADRLFWVGNAATLNVQWQALRVITGGLVPQHAYKYQHMNLGDPHHLSTRGGQLYKEFGDDDVEVGASRITDEATNYRRGKGMPRRILD